jgi:hypothetical protein
MEQTVESLIANTGGLEVMIHNDEAGMKAMQQKTDANQKEKKEVIKTNQAKADANLKEIRAGQEQMKEEIKVWPSGNEIHSKCHPRKDGGFNTLHLVVQVTGDHQTSGGRCPVICRPKDAGPPQKTEKTDETQVDIQDIRPSIDMQTQSLLEIITDTRMHLHKELQVEIQTMKAVTEATRHEFQTQLTEVDARAEHERAVKPLKFNRTTSWAVFRRQFETIAQHN